MGIIGTVEAIEGNKEIKPAIKAVTRIVKKFDLSYDQTRYLFKEVRQGLDLKRCGRPSKAIERLSLEEQKRFLEYAYLKKGHRGLLVKTLYLTGARVSAFTNIKVEDFFFEERYIHIKDAKGGKNREVPITRELAQELKTYLWTRTRGYLFESNRRTKFSRRRINQLVKEVAIEANISKRVYPHLLRHNIAKFLHENGMAVEKIQKFLGHSKIETTMKYLDNLAIHVRAEYDGAMSKF